MVKLRKQNLGVNPQKILYWAIPKGEKGYEKDFGYYRFGNHVGC